MEEYSNEYAGYEPEKDTDGKWYGTPRHSGRYPWGSGKDPYQRNSNFLAQVKALKDKGWSESQIASSMGMNTSQLRAKKSIAKNEMRKQESAEAFRLKEKGYSNVEIGKRLGKGESSVRLLLDPALQERATFTNAIAEELKKAVDQKEYIDIGTGTEQYLGCSGVRLKTAVSILQEQGYKVQYVNVDQLGTGKKTSIKVLTKDDVDWKELNSNKDKISIPTNFYLEDGGNTVRAIEPPVGIDVKRVYINFTDADGKGGAEKDGLIELRRGVDDISLKDANYAQVRIAVDGYKASKDIYDDAGNLKYSKGDEIKSYMKGMAVYSDNIPDGYDIVYNTNKTPEKIDKVFKEMKPDPSNPFGAAIKDDYYLIRAQRHYTDADGNERLSALNIVNEEGNWGEWSRTLASQVLSKQPIALAKKQLGLAYDIREEEFTEIKSVTNPVVKKNLLESFAEDCDAAAVDLKAAALPRQAAQVILPVPSMREDRIYAPNYKDGETVVLIRFPHAGKFEIPVLTVDNTNKEARAMIGTNPVDAVCISPKTAENLSGADFDGDTVLVIPNNSGSIQTSPSLTKLRDFDPKAMYPKYPGMKVMTPREKGIEMGKITNLITDMSLRKATDDELARAVRHSMVVIDAEKHELNYKQSFIDNGIAELKLRYQGRADAGASTLISKASSEKRVDYRTDGVLVKDRETGKTTKKYIDPETGEKLYTYTGETYKAPVRKDGKIVGYKDTKKTVSSSWMYEAKDAFELSSGTAIEGVYANHANKLKALANEARKETLKVVPTKYNPEAKKYYAFEVSSLMAQLNTALKNAPLERQAQLLANKLLAQKKEANPALKDDHDKLKKTKGQCLTQARTMVGAKKTQIKISPREWEAIQAGAVTTNVLSKIISNCDMDIVKQYSMPKTKTGLSTAKVSMAKSMLNKGYTTSEVADYLGISTSSLNRALQPK